MTFVIAIRRLFLLVAMLGVVTGPMSIGLAGSAMASSGVPAMEVMASAMPGMDTISMPGMQMLEDMPCCPEKQPVKADCGKGCPLALVCTTSISANTIDSHGWSFAISWRTHRYDILPASQLMSALVEPPARPPKA